MVRTDYKKPSSSRKETTLYHTMGKKLAEVTKESYMHLGSCGKSLLPVCRKTGSMVSYRCINMRPETACIMVLKQYQPRLAGKPRPGQKTK